MDRRDFMKGTVASGVTTLAMTLPVGAVTGVSIPAHYFTGGYTQYVYDISLINADWIKKLISEGKKCYVFGNQFEIYLPSLDAYSLPVWEYATKIVDLETNKVVKHQGNYTHG